MIFLFFILFSSSLFSYPLTLGGLFHYVSVDIQDDTSAANFDATGFSLQAQIHFLSPHKLTLSPLFIPLQLRLRARPSLEIEVVGFSKNLGHLTSPKSSIAALSCAGNFSVFHLRLRGVGQLALPSSRLPEMPALLPAFKLGLGYFVPSAKGLSFFYLSYYEKQNISTKTSVFAYQMSSQIIAPGFFLISTQFEFESLKNRDLFYLGLSLEKQFSKRLFFGIEGKTGIVTKNESAFEYRLRDIYQTKIEILFPVNPVLFLRLSYQTKNIDLTNQKRYFLPYLEKYKIFQGQMSVYF